MDVSLNRYQEYVDYVYMFLGVCSTIGAAEV